jgi:hypothetical protein
LLIAPALGLRAGTTDLQGVRTFSAILNRAGTQSIAAPAEVPEEVIDALRPHLTPPRLVELASAIAWENYRARFSRAFAVEAEGFAEGRVCAVPGILK